MLLKKMVPVALVFLLFVIFSTGISSCNNRSYPCPGLGQTDAADLSMFQDGKLKPEFNKKRERINKETGIINKKSPKKIRRRRRTKI